MPCPPTLAPSCPAHPGPILPRPPWPHPAPPTLASPCPAHLGPTLPIHLGPSLPRPPWFPPCPAHLGSHDKELSQTSPDFRIGLELQQSLTQEQTLGMQRNAYTAVEHTPRLHTHTHTHTHTRTPSPTHQPAEQLADRTAVRRPFARTSRRAINLHCYRISTRRCPRSGQRPAPEPPLPRTVPASLGSASGSWRPSAGEGATHHTCDDMFYRLAESQHFSFTLACRSSR